MKLQSLLFCAALAVLALFAAGCQSKSGQGGGETISLVGAGSTFVNPIMSRWTAAFQQSHPNVQTNYQSIGSGAGIQQVKAGTVDFGASDVALNDEQLKGMPPVLQVPESAGPVCITYNLPDLKQPLKLTGAALSGIYLGTIKTWQDAAIAKANPGVNLPNTAIVVVHRSDGSGTTGIFTTYLAAVNPEWAKKVGSSISVNWPVGLGGKGSEGVTGVVKQTPGAIGYVELNYATENHLPVAVVENKAGKFVAPSAAGATAAIDAAKDVLAQDVRKPIVDPPASSPDAYPISGVTFLIIPKDGPDRAKRQELKDFVRYIVSDGQQLSQGLDYAALPSSISSLDQNLLSQMTAAGAPLK
ncbi:MAG TPA: phosphate ABC transporter substrate-binding protein PstS [Terriglobales bacterium]|nr:phosphate ABC transporter substrate-binding protein PstS [Terriglobales bacterium]